MSITAGMVQKLRDKTGAPMMDCKKALEATAGNFEAAEDHLRKSGLKSAAKKADRETSEGRVNVRLGPDGRSGAIMAVRCETDFVAKTDDFRAMLDEYTKIAFETELPVTDLVEAFSNFKTSSGVVVQEHLKLVIGKLGENIRIAGAAYFENKKGYVSAYVHHNSKVGALASVTTAAPREKAEEALKKLCQHIAFHKPQYLLRAEVPAQVIEREREVYRASEDVLKKPAEVREKIVTGKLEKYFSEICLSEQPWIFDDKQNAAKAIEQSLGAGSSIQAFKLFEI